MKKILLLMLGILMTLPTFARDFDYTYEGQTITYTVIDENAKTVMTKEGSKSAGGNSVSGTLVLPAHPKDGNVEYTLTSIGKYAFGNCRGLTSVTIPNSVTEIYESAFYICSGLTKAEFASIESLCSIYFENEIANPIAYAHHLYINGEEVTGVTIPTTVTSIGDYTFFDCYGLTSVTISTSVTSIGKYAFRGCRGMTSVTISNSVTSIGYAAFSGCSGLTSVTIPNSIISISDYLFWCSGLTSVTIPNSVTEIGEWVFGYCYGLTSVTIPNSVTSIGESAFSECSGLTSVTMPNSVTSICEYAFFGCSGLTSVTLSKNLSSIGNYAFSGCAAITEVWNPAETPIDAPDNIFASTVYDNATMYVPTKSVESYESVLPWNSFKKIVGYDFSGIDEVAADFDEELPYEVFSINGVKLADTVDGLAPGLYIVRQGRTVKKLSVN